MSGKGPQTGRATVVAAVLAAIFATGCRDEAAALPSAAAVVVPATRAPEASPPEALAVALVRAGSPKSSVREAALGELDRAGAQARGASLRALRSADIELRRGAANALARIADASCAPEIAAALEHADDIDAPALIDALGRSATGEAGDALVALVETGHELRAMRAAVALRDFNGPLDLARLRSAAAPDRPPFIRQSALFALGGHAERQDHALFHAASLHSTSTLREASARGLFATGLATGEDVRRLLIDDADPTVRESAATAARVLGEAGVGPLRDALGKIPEDDANPLMIASLVAIGGKAAFDCLLEFVLDDSQTSDDRGTAVRGLDAIDHDRAIVTLKREAAIFDIDLRVYCNEILATEVRR